MCGIAGVFDADAPSDDAVRIIHRLTNALRHRGPDDEGYFQSPTDGLTIGHRRLSTIDVSSAGAQPMSSRSGRWVVAFNGELYNHRTVRRELAARITEWRGHSDTETLVEALDAWGVDGTLERFDGMFAIAAYDTQDQRLVLVRDRIGEKPLYWLHAAGRMAFASELSALRQLPGIRLEIDPSAATALLRWSFIPHPFTIYTGVRQLAPGSLLEFDTLHPEQPPTERAWWSLGGEIAAAKSTRNGATLDAAADEFERLLGESVAARMESDVPLGAFLSGGIDSSLVAAMAQRSLGEARLRTFTVSMPSAGLDEAEHAAAVAQHLGTEHTTLNLRPDDAFALIPTLPKIWNEPFADPSMLPSALVCSAARAHVTVCLGGDGGDELFAGYNRHTLGVQIDHFGQRWSPWTRRRLARAALRLPPSLIEFGGRLAPGARIPNLADKVHKAAHLIAGDNPVWDQLAGIWPTSTLGATPHRPTFPTDAGPLCRVEEMILADTAAVLPDQMLVKLDRASMAASLEVRSPLLDPAILSWAWSLPLDYRTRRGVGKVVMRRVAAKLLPPGIAERRKLGFDPPLAMWLRKELRPWAEDLLANPRCVAEGWLDGDALKTTWAENLSGKRNWEYRLWAVLMLEAWLAEHHPITGDSDR